MPTKDVQKLVNTTTYRPSYTIQKGEDLLSTIMSTFNPRLD
jgi:hypothetical protein